MYIITGVEVKPKKDIWAGTYQCSSCGTEQYHHLYEIKKYSTVYFIPVFGMTIKRGIVCDNCKTLYELPKDEYKRIKNEQETILSEKGFPKDVILNDYNPRAIKYVLKTILLALASLVSFVMLFNLIKMMLDTDRIRLSVIIGVLVLLSVSLAPVFFAFRSFRRAQKKIDLYNLACQNSQEDR